MTIQIGGKTLAISRPGDLDARLVETTGCNAAEHAAMLTKGGSGFHVARALQPMLAEKDTMPVGDLATLIGDDVATVRQQVIALLAPPAPTPTGKAA